MIDWRNRHENEKLAKRLKISIVLAHRIKRIVFLCVLWGHFEEISPRHTHIFLNGFAPISRMNSVDLQKLLMPVDIGQMLCYVVWSNVTVLLCDMGFKDFLKT